MARFITNHEGVTHSVNDAEYAVHLDLANRAYTMHGGNVPHEATPDEVAAWYVAQGLPVPAEFAPAAASAAKASK